MSEQTQKSKIKKTMAETFEPLNEYLLVEKVEIDDKIGEIFIPDVDKWQLRWRIVATAKKLMPHVNDFAVGDILITPTGVAKMMLQIDDVQYFFLRKGDILCKIM